MARQIIKTLAVVLGISLGCSLMVTSTVLLLKERQTHNERVHKIGHLLELAEIGTADGEDPVQVYRTRIEPILVDLEVGRPVESEIPDTLDPVAYDIPRLASHPVHSVAIPRSLDLAGLRSRPRQMPVYLTRDDRGMGSLILPIYGKGLWSTLYGYLALKSDLTTIAGIGFYEHGETPGLGGEVDNPRWKAQWRGKLAFDERRGVAIRVIEGTSDPTSPEFPHRIDGLTGATTTTRGVDRLVRYWLGPHGYGPFLDWLRSREGAPL
jgi:Na+-transporting NADH:ubiquinone oxidoreductase subunit C